MMNSKFYAGLIWAIVFPLNMIIAQSIPLDTAHLDIQANAYVIEKYKGVPAIYLQGGMMTLKDIEFLDGTIEYDIFLKEERGFPGIFFRHQEDTQNAEHFYIRPHQSGNPDANQVVPLTNGISAWQLYHGPKYAIPYEYQYDDWTHVKILVNGDRAQLFLDHAETPQLSWKLFHRPRNGAITLQGGRATGLYIANIKVDHQAPSLVNFKPVEKPAIEGLVPTWSVSDKFSEASLQDIDKMEQLIGTRKWIGAIEVEEGTAANISRVHTLGNRKEGNTVFAKIEIISDRDQSKLFEFGYSDRVVALLNGKAIYRGNNTFLSRDYRYLGTIGLFDAIYLDLKKGKNILLMAVSENFGGWLITGRFADQEGIQISKAK